MESGGPPYPPRYVMLSDNQGSLRPPPYRRNIPRYDSKSHGSGRNSCLRCLCCCFCFVFVSVLILAAMAFFLFAFYQPKIPTYKINGFDVQSFNFRSDFTLYAEFLVTVRAENPNEQIGFKYGKDSSVVVMYTDSELCSGKLPDFHQPRKNTTMIGVLLKGKSEFGSGLQGALKENRDRGRIPLLVKVEVPVSVVIGDISLKEVVVYVNCSLVVDNLSPNKKVGILSSNYTYGASI